jgi:hypothetical protein
MGSEKKERIDRLEWDWEKLKSDPFFSGPTEFMIHELAKRLREVKQFKLIFGESIDGYRRMDFSERELPALRVYNNTFVKEGESWFINGDVKVDVILPASLRRNDLQQVQDTISAALLQQFRRPKFFDKMNGLVPGLNELGKIFSVDKSLGFEWGEDIVPLTQITLNFRLDLRQWDDYLESTNRTKDEPFEATLKNLELIANRIQGLNDDGTAGVEIDDGPEPVGG